MTYRGILRHLGAALVLLGAAGLPCCLAQPSSGQGCASVVAADRAYSIRLTAFVPQPSQASGALLEARIDRGPPLHLLLDSGAAQITLDARAAARSSVAPVAESHLVGVGESPVRSARSGIAGAVDLGPLHLRNCRIEMAAGKLAGGIDGVIPLSLFGGFLIRLDLPGKTLDLTPYPDRAATPTAGSARAVLNGDALFVRGTLDGTIEGHILLDTGASYSAVSRRTAKVLKSSLVSAVGLRGANGAVTGELVEAGVRFQVAGRSLMAEPVVALDLVGFSAFNGVETIGILGYPALRASILTVNYRDGLVRIDAPPNGPHRRTLIADDKKAGAP